jgi:hypothetical protein
LCSTRDIYVIEAKANKDEDFASIPGEDPHGKGLNENVYWITQDLLSDWQKLPDVKAADITSAREIKKMLTGNLDSPVRSFPFYSGKESALLRAQIARISAATTIVPGGIFKANPDNGIIIQCKE